MKNKEVLQDEEIKQNTDAGSETAVTEENVTEVTAESEAAFTADDAATIDGAVGAGVEPLPVNVYEPLRKKGARYGFYLFVKRFFDLISATLLFLVLSPFILIVLLIKWLEDFHNPVYVSKRVGKDGKIFRILKIRTMVPNAEEMKQQLIEQGLNEADPPAFKMKNDPRVTRFGKFLRKFSIDEVLQLLNVINSTMSVIGPRPPLMEEVEQYTEYQRHRLDVKGGLLCLWQVQKDRNKINFDDWVKLDIEYIEKQSLGLDIKILFKGIFSVLFTPSGE